MSKSLMESSVFNSIYRVLNIIYPLVTMAYLGRVLLAEGVGEITLAQNFASYFLLIAPLGIPNYGTKAIGSVQDNKNLRSKIFMELFLINGISTVLVFLIYISMFGIFKSYTDYILLVIFGIQILFNIFNVDWFYQGIEEYKYISIRSLAVKFFSLALILLFVKTRSDIYVYAVILVFATIGNYFFNIINLKKYINIKNQGLILSKHMRPIIILWASTVAMEIYTMVDSTMVGTICSKTELAYYSNANRVVRSIYGVLTAMTSVFLPRLSYYYKNNKDMFVKLSQFGLKINLFFAFPASVGFGLLADDIIPLIFGQDFNNSINVARVFSILIIVFSVSNIAGHVILIAVGEELTILKATVTGAVVNFVMNLILIHYYRYIGAAVASVIAETIVMILLHRGARKYIKYQFSFKYWISLVGATIIMAIVILIQKDVFTSGIARVAIIISSSVLLYFLCAKLFRNESAISLENKLRDICKKINNKKMGKK